MATKTLDAICARLKSSSNIDPSNNQQEIPSDNNSSINQVDVIAHDSDQLSDCSSDEGRSSNCSSSVHPSNKRKNFKPQRGAQSGSNVAGTSSESTSSVIDTQEPNGQMTDQTSHNTLLNNFNLFNAATLAQMAVAMNRSSVLNVNKQVQLPTETSAKPDQLKPVVELPTVGQNFEKNILCFGGAECGMEQCRYTSNKEHYHCNMCNFKLISKKEEVMRHLKWHRKREESLQQGFLRYSASDDCTPDFTNCPHNLRQTHYHCLQEGCGKVYISTSDVQMHSNSHRKAAHIAREGFQRFKASEDCGYNDCNFRPTRTNRTTHFHCLRFCCTYAFKNKSDMDKHKAHHLKDEELTKEGFKKYMKSEGCFLISCPFSRKSNHIHCIRPGCDYVLHSTSQMNSHKRKHDKNEKRPLHDTISPLQPPPQRPIQKWKIKQYEPHTQKFISEPETVFKERPVKMSRITDLNVPLKVKIKHYSPDMQVSYEQTKEAGEHINLNETTIPSNAAGCSGYAAEMEEVPAINLKNLQMPISLMQQVADSVHADRSTKGSERDSDEGKEDIADYESGVPSPTFFTTSTSAAFVGDNSNGGSKTDDWRSYITRYTANDRCIPLCTLMYKDHYHCVGDEGCDAVFRSKDGVRDHARQHQQLKHAAKFFDTVEAAADCRHKKCEFSKLERHYHCRYPDCSFSNRGIGVSQGTFKRSEHYKIHEYIQVTNNTSPSGSNVVSEQVNCSKPRKRGRPPKYLVNGEVDNGSPPHTPANFQTSTNSPTSMKRGRPRIFSSPHDQLMMDTSFLHSGFPMAPFLRALSKGNAFVAGTSCGVMDCRYKDEAFHFHCKSERCIFAAKSFEGLDSHWSDLHENTQIPNDQQCFDSEMNCGYNSCVHSNKRRHFHCTLHECEKQVFIKSSEAEQHAKTHKSIKNEPTSPTDQKLEVSGVDDLSPSMGIQKVRTAGTYFPDSTSLVEGIVAGDQMSRSLNPATAMARIAEAQQNLAKSHQSAVALMQPYTVEQHCGRPFCKLKRQVHYHCKLCPQAFSNYDRLRPHLMKHDVPIPQQNLATMGVGAGLPAAGMPSLHAGINPFFSGFGGAGSMAFSNFMATMGAFPGLSSPLLQNPAFLQDPLNLAGSIIGASKEVKMEPKLTQGKVGVGKVSTVGSSHSLCDIKDTFESSNNFGLPNVSTDSDAATLANKKIKFHLFQPDIGKFLPEEEVADPFATKVGRNIDLRRANGWADDPLTKKFKFIDCTESIAPNELAR